MNLKHSHHCFLWEKHLRICSSAARWHTLQFALWQCSCNHPDRPGPLYTQETCSYIYMSFLLFTLVTGHAAHLHTSHSAHNVHLCLFEMIIPDMIISYLSMPVCFFLTLWRGPDVTRKRYFPWGLTYELWFWCTVYFNCLNISPLWDQWSTSSLVFMHDVCLKSNVALRHHYLCNRRRSSAWRPQVFQWSASGNRWGFAFSDSSWLGAVMSKW